ncbi:hypothetical protein CORC01_12353 [Colletotrichum orchidophilum]|uniref:Uncharacterized protein n=1 Tax=Colletotrichum orchidophilum TaxID=1209926 RepID=A0A1G4AT86_9PEZI|nr:uncharacterized protein CORC01_12353 [Colletotrichum orchidophilum]OHE92358.1 hypothetical protein CORC01_12353 [Colletotrichum orchidophilum]
MRPLRAAGASSRTATTATAACFHTTTSLLARQRPRVHEKKRPADPQVPYSWQPFEVPDVVLDLDSWDNPIARPYNADEMSAQRKKWEQNPQIDATWKRIKNFEKERQHASERFAKVSAGDPWHQHWQVTDLDIMTAALRGPPRVHERQTEEWPHQNEALGVLRSVAWKNGIPSTTFQDDKNFLSWLLQRRSTMTSSPLRRQRDIRSFIRRLQDLKNLKRYLQFLLQHGDKGLQLIHQADKDITLVLSQLLSDPKGNLQSLADFLPFLNSIFALQEHQGLPVGQGLCGICLIVSAQAFQLPAVARYLKLGLKEGHWVGEGSSASDVKTAVEALNRCWSKANHSSVLDSSEAILRRLLGTDLVKHSTASFRFVAQHHLEDEGLQQQFSQLLSRAGLASSVADS